MSKEVGPILILFYTYPVLIFILGLISLISIFLGIYIIRQRTSIPASQIIPSDFKSHLQDLSAIAGEDVIATQLDLAKAYLESDQLFLAKTILHDVLRKGNPKQKHEAELLLKPAD